MVVILIILAYIVVVGLNMILGKHVPGLVKKDDARDIDSFAILSIIPVINVIVLIGCLVFALVQRFKDYIRK